MQDNASKPGIHATLSVPVLAHASTLHSHMTGGELNVQLDHPARHTSHAHVRHHAAIDVPIRHLKFDENEQQNRVQAPPTCCP